MGLSCVSNGLMIAARKRFGLRREAVGELWLREWEAVMEG
jgi:hypothetical protein